MKLIMTIILSAVGIFAGRFIYHKFFAETPCNPPAGMECASLEHLRHVGREVSAELPKQLDQETTLKRVWARESEIIYDVELVNFRRGQIDREKFESAAFVELRKFFCKSREGRMFRKYNIAATFQVTGGDGFNIGTVSVGTADCKWTS